VGASSKATVGALPGAGVRPFGMLRASPGSKVSGVPPGRGVMAL